MGPCVTAALALQSRVMGRKIILGLFLTAGVLAIGAEDEQALRWGVGIRLWGADASLSYAVAEPLEDGATRLWLSAGGGYQDAHLYRQFVGNETAGTHADTPIPGNTATYKNLNVQVAAGASQDIPLGFHRLSVFLLGKIRYEYHDPVWASDALIFGSSLPDRIRLLENALLFGLHFKNQIPLAMAASVFPILYSLEASLHYAPGFLLNEVADYARASAVGTFLAQVVNRMRFKLFLAARMGFDGLWGTAYPVYARMTAGQIGAPFFTCDTALGGTLRGVASGRFDGTAKLYANVDVRFRVPINPQFVPTAILFFDGGVSDYRRLDHRLDPADALYSVGVNVAANIAGVAEIGYLVAYALTEPDEGRRLSHGLTFGAHF